MPLHHAESCVGWHLIGDHIKPFQNIVFSLNIVTESVFKHELEIVRRPMSGK